MELIWSLFFRTWWTNQLNAGSCWMPLAMAYSTTCIECDSWRFDNFSHDLDSSFYLQQTSQPAIDFLRVSHPWWLPFDSLHWELNHFFCDWQMLWIVYIHFCWHHTWCILTLQWCLLPVHSYLIKACIQNGVLIGSTNWVTIGIVLLVYHLASGHFVPSHEQYFCIHILVPHSGVTSGSSPNMGNISAFCDSIIWIILWCDLHSQLNQLSQLSARTQFLV